MESFPADWPTRPVTAGGLRGGVAVIGRGPPVALLPSLIARPVTYRAAVMALARTHRVFVIEVPGSGRAERLSRQLSLEEYADWVGAVLGTVAPTGVTLVGHSHAGGVAVHVADRFPDRVRALVVADGIGANEPGRVLGMVAGGVHDLIAEWRLVRRAWPDVARNLVRHPRTVFHHARVAFVADVLPVARRLRVPTVVAWGGRDRLLPARHGERLAAAVPGARFELFAGGSHAWEISHADRFAAVVAAAAPALLPVARPPLEASA